MNNQLWNEMLQLHHKLWWTWLVSRGEKQNTPKKQKQLCCLSLSTPEGTRKGNTLANNHNNRKKTKKKNGDCCEIWKKKNLHEVVDCFHFYTFVLYHRFGTSLKRHEKRRRRRHLLPEVTTELSSAVGTDSWEIDGGDLSSLDFSQVFVPESMKSHHEPADGFVLGRRAHHLVNLLAQPDTCLVRNILQIWNFDLQRIRSLSQQQILKDVNEALLKGSVRLI